jgi:recombinational DNA repair protein RecR
MEMGARSAQQWRWGLDRRNEEDGRATGTTMKMGAQQVRFYYPCMKRIQKNECDISEREIGRA